MSDYSQGALCSVCNQPFTAQEWEDRHDDDDGLDCHSYCCPECHGDVVYQRRTGFLDEYNRRITVAVKKDGE